MIEFGFGVMAGRKVEALETRTELPPRKAQAEETRRRILEAAVEAFSAQLYDEVSVGDIATSAGVAHAPRPLSMGPRKVMWVGSAETQLGQANFSATMRPSWTSLAR